MIKLFVEKESKRKSIRNNYEHHEYKVEMVHKSNRLFFLKKYKRQYLVLQNKLVGRCYGVRCVGLVALGVIEKTASLEPLVVCRYWLL